jgi:hypothetical protein
MTIPIDIRIKMVLLMAKFESPMVVRRKLQVEFGNKTPSVVSIQATFERFCETGTEKIENVPEDHRKLQKKRLMKSVML